MLKSLIYNVLVGEMRRLGQDEHGNIIVSEHSLAEVAAKVATEASKAVHRPVVTVSLNDIMHASLEAGFEVRSVRVAQDVNHRFIAEPTTGADVTSLASRLVDAAVRLTLERVADFTAIQEPGGAHDR